MIMEKAYQQCSLSVMDNIEDPNIHFDENGICNYYYEYLEKEKRSVFKGQEGEDKLAKIIQEVKKNGKGKAYDCITGVSGGVDSTYLTYKAKEWGLRPLVVHFDNGWNSELAVKNIENIINKLGFDLYTLVVNWEEFKDIQLAYLRASVVDIEAITDHAILGSLYRLAAEHGVKYILSGANVVTEATLPSYWIWNKYDHVNIKDIHKQYGSISLKTFPFFSFKEKKYYQDIKGIQTLPLLNYVPYNKKEVKQTITEKLSWRDYGGKHYESVFTRFYQGYILPEKFKIDKRKAHLSNLIFSGQIQKEEALAELEQPGYDPTLLATDKAFVLKKFNLSETEFEDIMSLPRREHSEFKTELGFFQQYPYLKPLRPMVKLAKKIF